MPTPSADAEKPAWLEAFRGGAPTFGSFRMAGLISDAFNLAAISMRLGGQRLVWDAAATRITNRPEANALLGREYRKGWELGAEDVRRRPPRRAPRRRLRVSHNCDTPLPFLMVISPNRTGRPPGHLRRFRRGFPAR